MRLSRVPTVARTGIATGLFLSVLFLSGCGKSTGNVSGKVTFKGAPLKGGTVGFVDSGGKVFGAAMEGDGSYTIKNLPTGEYTVTVETTSVKGATDVTDAFAGGTMKGSGPPVVKKGMGAPPKDAQLPEGYKGSNPADSAAANAAKHYVLIQSNYAKKETSNLKYTAVAGDQTHDIDLKP
jgi:hypothetical protein